MDAAPNTIFQCVKNNFLLSQKKLIFFTILNLTIVVMEWQYRPPPREPVLRQLHGAGVVAGRRGALQIRQRGGVPVRLHHVGVGGTAGKNLR